MMGGYFKVRGVHSQNVNQCNRTDPTLEVTYASHFQFNPEVFSVTFDLRGNLVACSAFSGAQKLRSGGQNFRSTFREIATATLQPNNRRGKRRNKEKSACHVTWVAQLLDEHNIDFSGVKSV